MKNNIDRILEKIKNKNISLNEVVKMEDIEKFEKENNIKLPEELIFFYTKICNGCVMLDGFNLLKMQEWKCDINNLKEDFEFEKYWIWEDDYNEEKIKHITYGNIKLIDIGDAQSWNIIVNGKERGKMWLFTDVGIQPCAPSMDLLEWFEFWLDGKEDFFYEFSYE